MSDEPAIVIEDNWECYSFETSDGPVFVTFFAGANAIEQARFPHCVRVLVPIHEPNERGGPVDAEADRIYQLEDELIAHLQQQRVRCLQVARLTHSGIREIVFQVQDLDAFRPQVSSWRKHVADYDVDVSEHPGWTYFEQCIWPSDDDWMLIHDRHVVERLIAAGSNPDKDHAIEVVFLGSPDGLRRLAEQLSPRGYQAGPHKTPNHLVLVKRMPLDLTDIWSESLANRRAAAACQVQYDGWGAAVER